MSAISAFIYYFFSLCSVTSVYNFGRKTLQFVFLQWGQRVLRQFAYNPMPINPPKSQKDDNEFQGIIFAFVIADIFHGTVQVAVYGPYSCYHSGVPVIVLEIGQHIAVLNPFADGIRQYPFKAISGSELHTPLVGGKQDDQSIVTFFCPTPVSCPSRWAKSKQSPPSMPVTATTNVCIPVFALKRRGCCP